MDGLWPGSGARPRAIVERPFERGAKRVAASRRRAAAPGGGIRPPRACARPSPTLGVGGDVGRIGTVERQAAGLERAVVAGDAVLLDECLIGGWGRAGRCRGRGLRGRTRRRLTRGSRMARRPLEAAARIQTVEHTSRQTRPIDTPADTTSYAKKARTITYGPAPARDGSGASIMTRKWLCALGILFCRSRAEVRAAMARRGTEKTQTRPL